MSIPRGHIWAVGDEVIVRGRGMYGEKYAPRTVSRVLKRFIELSDGSKWSQRGWVYPAGEGYCSRYLQLPTPELLDKAHRCDLLARIKSVYPVKMEKFSTEKLERIWKELI